MSNWNDLSLKEKAAMMQVAVGNGIYNLSDIRKAYNEFAEGGDTEENIGEVPSTVGSSILNLAANTLRNRLYKNIEPFGYNDPQRRLFDALVLGKDEHGNFVGDVNDSERAPAQYQTIDDIWAEYLHIPQENRRYLNGKYHITKNSNGTYSLPYESMEDIMQVVNSDNPLLPGQKGSAGNSVLGQYGVRRGFDSKGDYLEYNDTWRINPWAKTSEGKGYGEDDQNSLLYQIFKDKKDASLGIGTPLEIKGRYYLDDIYGNPRSNSVYLPEITVTPTEYKHGGKIYIKPSHRGKFTRLKERTGHSASWFKLHGTPAQKKMATFALNARKWKHGEGGPLVEAANIYEDGGTKDISGTRKAWYIDFKRRNGRAPSYLDNVKRNLYNLVNPAEGYPKSAFELLVEKPVQAIAAALLPNTVKVRRGGNEEPASEAAWAKRMGMPYDESLVINNGDNSYRLSRQYEQEIPVDTVAIKKRIEANQKLADSPNMMGEQWRLLNEYINADKNTLDSLRHTYATGEPVVINEFSYNSRKAMDENGNVVPVTSPLNVLQNYTVQYDKENNAMNYRDIYDFNQFEPFVPGEPFNFKGTIPLKKEYGGPLIYLADKYYR